MTTSTPDRTRISLLTARTFQPRRYRPGNLGTWSGHLPFVNDLIAAMKPSLLVELGTHYGESYFGMCQAVQENGVSCKCYAVDTWQGDPHAGYYDESVFTEVNSYNEEHYSAFSKLLRTTFDDAKQNFGDGTVDLLHIDGLHTYDAIQHDFNNWFPKVRPGGVVLLHDTTARHADFRVWKLWEELAGHFPHLEFHHSWGLGVLQKPGASGTDAKVAQAIFSASPSEQDFLRHYYATQAEVLERRHLAAAIGASSMDTYLQVFPCLTNGYGEATSIMAPLKAGAWQHVLLELPQGSGKGRIRVDPAHRPCVIRLAGVVLRRALDGSTLKSWTAPADLEAFSPIADLVTLEVGEGITFLSTGGDPQFLLPELDAAFSDQPLVFDARIRIDEDLASAAALVQSGTPSSPRHSTVAAERDRAIAERDAALVRREQLSAEVRNLQAERVAVVADYRRIHGINDSLTNEVASLKCSLSASQARAGRLEEEAGALLQERLALEEEAGALLQERLVLEEEAGALLQERLALEGEIQKRRQEEQRLVQENVQLAQELKTVYQSRSWWLTAPLRRLFRALT